MLIKLHGKFAKDYGSEHYIEAHTIADAVEGLTRQIGFYGHLPIEQRPLVRIAGVDDLSTLGNITEQKEIHLPQAATAEKKYL